MIRSAGLHGWCVESMSRPSYDLILVLGYKIYNKSWFYLNRGRARPGPGRARPRAGRARPGQAELVLEQAELGLEQAELGLDLVKLNFLADIFGP